VSPAYAIKDTDGQTVYFEGFIRDISERKLAEHVESALYRIAEKTSSAGDINELHAGLQAIATLRRLKQLGGRISMDDFGTGYSSLASLKIDKSFIADVTTDDKGAAVVRAIISPGHGMGVEILAEGVETQEQREHLFREGCDAYQGFLFSRPIPAGEIERLLSAAAAP
jgi:EAL domain-containing protein (putative c-di-GMP-specific phosphodiesterase class I)